MKKSFIFILSLLCTLGLSSCRDERQEKLDNRNTIENFLEIDTSNPNCHIRFKYRVTYPHLSSGIDEKYEIYELLKTIEYTEIALSKTPIHEYGSFVFGYWFDNEERPRKFVLLDNLVTIYVYDVIDGILYIKDSYRYYSIKKEDGQKIMELATQIVEEDGNENN